MNEEEKYIEHQLTLLIDKVNMDEIDPARDLIRQVITDTKAACIEAVDLVYVQEYEKSRRNGILIDVLRAIKSAEVKRKGE